VDGRAANAGGDRGGGSCPRTRARPGTRRDGGRQRQAVTIAAAIARGPARFAEEQAEVCAPYATVLEDDGHFRRALRVRGPLLGLPADETDAPSAELRALYGMPVAPAPLEGEP
jgi:hypothetical protein